MLLDSGFYGDVYKIGKGLVEKICYSNSGNVHEIDILEKLNGVYGIPKYYRTNKYLIKRFFGKHGDGIYCSSRDELVKRGPACGIVMEYVGDLTLDNFNKFTYNQLLKIFFNACYTAYLMHSMHKIVHGDLHRRNVVLQRVKPYSKTYYINNEKYKITNQVYKVSLIDFDSCKPATPENEMDDIKYLCSFFDNKFEDADTVSDFFNNNYDCYKVG